MFSAVELGGTNTHRAHDVLLMLSFCLLVFKGGLYVAASLLSCDRPTVIKCFLPLDPLEPP